MSNFSQYWESICQIYFLTKHYLILAEELSEEFDTFLQPVKEHRDAFDHIARVYGYKYLQSEIKNVDVYRSENMNKAVGHVYRAFFDTADWLSYICRKKIRQLLSGKTREEILAVYPSYDGLKSMLNEIPIAIANIRKNKDVSDDITVLVREVEGYRAILDKLLKAYSELNELF